LFRVVTGFPGIGIYEPTWRGRTDHAGTISMDERLPP